MLNEIEIQNFRCFEETKISGFARVNLIGGKNNSGKTALLEALYLFNAPLPTGILFLMRLRNESLSFSKAFPEKTWDNLFFRQRKENPLRLKYNLTFPTNLKAQKNIYLSFNKQNLKIDFSQLISSLLRFTIKYLIEEVHDMETGVMESNSELISFFYDKKEQELSPFETEKLKIKEKEKKLQNFKLGVFFLPSNQRLSSQELAIRYDQSVLNNQASEILNILKIIDSSIEEIRTLSLGEPQIYLRRKDEQFLPISFFGDALNRIIEIVINLIDVKNGILLIDEIENGIHYLNQREFWLNLFKLAKVLDVQIFATTHSLEMIKAFADIGLNQYPEEAAYIELARHPKTNQIIGIKRDMETLDYAIEHEKGVGLRGE